MPGAAPEGGDGDGAESFDPRKNKSLERAVREALQDEVPASWVHQVIQLAGQGVWDFEPEEYTTDWDSEAYNTVSGQSSNNSLRLTDTFMAAVLDDGWWELVNRTDGKSRQTVKARELWEKISYAAWACADPGIQFHTTINDWHTCPVGADPRLQSVLGIHVPRRHGLQSRLAQPDGVPRPAEPRKIKKFDVAAFEHAVRLWTIVLEISVLMAQFPSKEIAQLSYDYRTLGLGYANIGGLLMAPGIPTTAAKAAPSPARSRDHDRRRLRHLGRDGGELGALPRLRRQPRAHAARHPQPSPRRLWRRKTATRAVGPPGAARHRRSAPRPLARAAKRAWDDALVLGEKHGYRNAQVTVIAPTGTIGLVMDCDTTGVEPDFALVKFKKLAGGGYFKIINRAVPEALQTLGYASRADRRHRRLCGRPRHAGRGPRRPQTTRCAPRASATSRTRQGRRRRWNRLRHPLRLQQVDAGRGVLHRTLGGSTEPRWTRPASTC
jgi:ribonucleoside-diphosphate reductase alpha chain